MEMRGRQALRRPAGGTDPLGDAGGGSGGGAPDAAARYKQPAEIRSADSEWADGAQDAATPSGPVALQACRGVES